MRFPWIALFCALSLWGANVKLYLKDGTWHVVREYEVKPDRIRFYSVERGDWEEMPLDLVDLKRTEGEIKDRDDSEKREAAASDAEEKADRAAKREAASVPQENGAYLAEGGQLKPMKLAEAKIVNNKRRTILKMMSPIPMVSGKATLELDGQNAAVTVRDSSPEFYFRISQAQRFGIIKLSAGKEGRIVEKITIMPVTNEMVEEPEEVEVFRREVGDLVYKIWPVKPLEPGEYAVVEYTPGKVNLQIYDFRYQNEKGEAPAPAPPPKPAAKSKKKK